MTALQILKEDGLRENQLSLTQVREMAQQEALDRLIALLDSGSTEGRPINLATGSEADSLHQLSRLRAARASYSLATTDEMMRVSRGAWLHRRHV